MAELSPRKFDAMRADRVMDMASRRFGKAYTSKYAAVMDLSALPVVEQHALKKRANPSKKNGQKSTPSAYRFYDTRGGLAPAPAPEKLAQAVIDRPKTVMRLARATTGMKVSSPAQALTLLMKFGSTDIKSAANAAYSIVAHGEGGRWRAPDQPQIYKASGKRGRGTVHVPTIVPVPAAASVTAVPAVAARPAPPAKPGMAKIVGPLGFMIVGAMTADAARTAAKSALASGKTSAETAVEAGKAAAGALATGTGTLIAASQLAQAAAAVATKLAPKIGPKLIPGLGLALYAGSIVKDGYDGYLNGGLKAAALGAGDAATFGIVSAIAPARTHLNARAASSPAPLAVAAPVSPPSGGDTYQRTYTTGPKAGTTETVRKAR